MAWRLKRFKWESRDMVLKQMEGKYEGHRGRPVRKIHILKIMEKALPVWDYLRWVVLFAKATI